MPLCAEAPENKQIQRKPSLLPYLPKTELKGVPPALCTRQDKGESPETTLHPSQGRRHQFKSTQHTKLIHCAFPSLPHLPKLASSATFFRLPVAEDGI